MKKVMAMIVINLMEQLPSLSSSNNPAANGLGVPVVEHHAQSPSSFLVWGSGCLAGQAFKFGMETAGGSCACLLLGRWWAPTGLWSGL